MSKNIDLLSKEPAVVQKIIEMVKVTPDNFSGPSVYFHQRAIELSKSDKDFLTKEHIEYIYATLASWGMHRMGPNGAKMPYFTEFIGSILSCEDFYRNHRHLSVDNVTQSDFYELLEELTEKCFLIKATKSNSPLVSSSKTLAHILPNLVPPIDRQYTLEFFHVHDYDVNTPSKAKIVFKEIMMHMFKFFQNDDIVFAAKESFDNEFRDSLPKIFDNVIINCVKNGLTSHQKILSKHSI